MRGPPIVNIEKRLSLIWVGCAAGVAATCSRASPAAWTSVSVCKRLKSIFVCFIVFSGVFARVWARVRNQPAKIQKLFRISLSFRPSEARGEISLFRQIRELEEGGAEGAYLSNKGKFNAPSREAIYYRIHKLAYGASWKYDYETFVSWDAKNR